VYVHLIAILVVPPFTALIAYLICPNSPVGEKVVREKLYDMWACYLLLEMDGWNTRRVVEVCKEVF